MHSISPYIVRIRNKNSRNENLKLQEINFFSLLRNFIESDRSIICDNTSNQAYSFEDIHYEQYKIYGWLKAGNFGIATDIHNIDSGDIDFNRTTKHADLAKHYFQFCLPNSNLSDEGLCVFHGYGTHGKKTLFLNEFNKYLDNLERPLIMQLNPISYQKAFDRWKDASIKDLRIVKFSGFSDDTDRLHNLGHREEIENYELKIKLKTGLTLSGLFKRHSNEKNLIEACTPLGEQVKTVIENNGKRRTLNLGHRVDEQFCQIELDDDSVVMIDNFPEFNSFHAWVNEILNEYLEDLYPTR